MTSTETATETDVLTDVLRARARAEAAEIVAMQDYRDAEMARTAHVEPALRRKIERSAIGLSIGEAMALSEAQVWHRLSVADTVRDKTPNVWAAFCDGLIDFTRVREIGSAVDKLHREESVARLDLRVVAYAIGHTTAELRQWLKRFIRRVEADLAVERADDARRERHVSVKHDDDSMAWLNAYLPSHQATAIEERLHREARKPTEPDDERTVAQREADLLVDWCTKSETGTSAIDANIAVTIGADVLAGFNPGFAESTDGRWAVPAAWITDVTATGSTFWHRIVTDPVTDDVLSHEYLGYQTPETLKIALRFLHGTCQAPGCMVPAERCDIDHRQPWPEGPTTGDNLGPLCRRHHSMKGHGLLHWSTRPPGKRKAKAKHLVIEIYQDPVFMEYAA
jgi:hypothetical protein